MNTALFLSFLAATMIIVVTPGPSVALASSQAMRFGNRAALVTVLGDALGSMVHILIATLGLQLLLATAEAVLPTLQVAGGVYILYLGVKSIRDKNAVDVGNLPSSSNKEAFTSGFLACVSNPKAIVFFAALFPGFIDPQLSIGFQSLVYGTIFVLLDAMFILGYAAAAVAVFKTSLGGRANFNIISGIGLGLIGLLLIVKGISDVMA